MRWSSSRLPCGQFLCAATALHGPLECPAPQSPLICGKVASAAAQGVHLGRSWAGRGQHRLLTSELSATRRGGPLHYVHDTTPPLLGPLTAHPPHFAPAPACMDAFSFQAKDPCPCSKCISEIALDVTTFAQALATNMLAVLSLHMRMPLACKMGKNKTMMSQM